MATIYEVSKLAGVSLATVSRVINNNTRVSTKTMAKVKSAMEALNYTPNSMAQSLASNRSNSAGILVSELRGPFYGEMMSGIEKRLRANHKHAVITAGHSNEQDEKDGIEFLIARNCDALILHVDAVSDDYLIQLSERPTPIILINRYIEQLSDRCIYLDNVYGGYLATQSLLVQGHRQLGYISGPLWKQDSRDRFIGHNQALKEHNIAPLRRPHFIGNFQETGGIEGMNYLLKHQTDITAVICGNDEMAAGAMQVLRDNGYNIPQDISIVGFDNAILAKYLHPKLTTINFPIYDMGVMCANWIIKNIYHQPNIEITNVFKPSLIVGQSSSQHSSTE